VNWFVEKLLFPSKSMRQFLLDVQSQVLVTEHVGVRTLVLVIVMVKGLQPFTSFTWKRPKRLVYCAEAAIAPAKHSKKSRKRLTPLI
jgi:hypothetical protein